MLKKPAKPAAAHKKSSGKPPTGSKRATKVAAEKSRPAKTSGKKTANKAKVVKKVVAKKATAKVAPPKSAPEKKPRVVAKDTPPKTTPKRAAAKPGKTASPKPATKESKKPTAHPAKAPTPAKAKDAEVKAKPQQAKARTTGGESKERSKKKPAPTTKTTKEGAQKTLESPKKVAAPQPKAKSVPQERKKEPQENAGHSEKVPSPPLEAKEKSKPAPPSAPPSVVLPPKPESPAAPPKPKPKGEILPKQFLLDLVATVREAVVPVARSARSRQVVSTAPSGDATFEIDVVAEKALLGFLRNAKFPVAYYSEDAGYSTFTSAAPKYLLVIDPIDGTRAAKNGFEGCTVSVASTRTIERPTMADLDNGCVAEILGDRIFYAERGKGVRMTEGGSVRRPRLSTNETLETLTWSMTVPARPAELIFPTAARLIDLSSLKGGFFACNSTSYSLTRLLTGQLDACVDFAGRYLKDIPECVEDYFINAGRGNPMGICPYDLAASLLIAREAGCIVTDAYGKGFDHVLLLDSSVSNQQSLIAAGNAELHKLLLSFFDTRIRQYESLLEQRAARKERQEA